MTSKDGAKPEWISSTQSSEVIRHRVSILDNKQAKRRITEEKLFQFMRLKGHAFAARRLRVFLTKSVVFQAHGIFNASSKLMWDNALPKSRL